MEGSLKSNKSDFSCDLQMHLGSFCEALRIIDGRSGGGGARRVSQYQPFHGVLLT